MVQDRASLGDVLYRLRSMARLSRQKLADFSGVSEGQLGNIERDEDQRTKRPPQPRVDTLRRIADGLAYSEKTKTTDTEEANRYYLELAIAAGLFPPAYPDDRPMRPAREQIAAILASDPRVMTAFEGFPPNMDDEDVAALCRHIAAVAEDLHRRK